MFALEGIVLGQARNGPLKKVILIGGEWITRDEMLPIRKWLEAERPIGKLEKRFKIVLLTGKQSL